MGMLDGGHLPVVVDRAAVFGVHLRRLESGVHAHQGNGESDEGGEIHFE